VAASRLTLEVDLGLAIGRGAIALLPLDSRAFGEVQSRVEELIGGIQTDVGMTFDWQTDGYGYRWIVLSDAAVDELAISIGIVADELGRAGHSDLLLCGVFAFDERTKAANRSSAYLVFSFQRGRFYPFVPCGHGRRDSKKEEELATALEEDLVLEADRGLWFPLWELPV
jgi:hypothetical protein